MKTFSDDALAALQRGDAIVSASVEIIRSASVTGEGLLAIACAEGQTAEVSWWQNGFIQSGGPDQACMGIAFLDSGASEITSPTFAALQGYTSWTSRSLSAVAPAGTAAVRIYQKMHRLAGFNNDGYIDDIQLTIDGDPVSVSNPGGELGTDGWTSTVGALTTRSASPAPHSGSAYFMGSTNGSADTTAFYPSDDVVSISETAIRLWGGYGRLDLPSDEGTSTFKGIGDRGLIQSSTGAIGGTAQNLTLVLSGIEPAAIEVLNPDEVRGASVVVRRLIFDSAGKTLLGAYVYTRGRVDELKTSEIVGGAAAIQLSVEGAARGLGRRGGRARSDADQRLVSPTDGFYRVVSAAPKKTLYWGGKTPSIGGSLTGGGGGTTSASTSISSVRSF